MSRSHGRINWIELNTRDVAAARAYYSEVCGWEWEEEEMPTGGVYLIARSGGEGVAGIFDMTDAPAMQDIPAHWLLYLAVDDVDAAVRQTAASGGTVLRPPWDVPGVGRVSIVKDPSGGAIGLVTPV